MGNWAPVTLLLRILCHVSCKKHNRHYHWTIKMEFEHSVSTGTLKLINSIQENTTPVQTTSTTASTKRKVLATTASIFDPLGLLSPNIIVYKIFLQNLWQDNLKWDEPLTSHLQEQWNQLFQNNPKLSQLKINRKVICTNSINIQIHGYNSCGRAYAACLYIRSTIRTKTSCVLLCSTSKLAQLKKPTIPRVQPCAATLVSKLYMKATRALSFTKDESYLWTDASIVLTWLKGPSNKGKTFVGNRVALIQEETVGATWRHVPSQSNPADLISRGIEPTTLSNSTLWWKRPKWLSPGFIQLAYNRGQHYYRQHRNQTCASCITTNSTRFHPEIFQVKSTHQRYCILQKFYT